MFLVIYDSQLVSHFDNCLILFLSQLNIESNFLFKQLKNPVNQLKIEKNWKKMRKDLYAFLLIFDSDKNSIQNKIESSTHDSSKSVILKRIVIIESLIVTALMLIC